MSVVWLSNSSTWWYSHKYKLHGHHVLNPKPLNPQRTQKKTLYRAPNITNPYRFGFKSTGFKASQLLLEPVVVDAYGLGYSMPWKGIWGYIRNLGPYGFFFGWHWWRTTLQGVCVQATFVQEQYKFWEPILNHVLYLIMKLQPKCIEISQLTRWSD